MTTVTPEHLERLRTLCADFRDAIERVPPAQLTSQMARFPHGACDDTALLLARRLGELGYEALQLRYARYGHDEIPPGHAWLRLDDIDIDITADQFSDQAQRVIVERASPWHAGLRVVEDQRPDYRAYTEPHVVAAFDRAYARIMAAH